MLGLSTVVFVLPIASVAGRSVFHDGDMLWFPWASKRNKVEAAVHFFNVMRDDTPMVEYADDEAKPFFEMICRHGIMRRVETSFSVYPGKSVAVFETRATEKQRPPAVKPSAEHSRKPRSDLPDFVARLH